MKQKYCNQKPSSFAKTVELVEDYVRQEIKQEIKAKELRYHNLEHAVAVKRRANIIFSGIKPVLSLEHSAAELQRLESLINLCALAHDMVQLFDVSVPPYRPRKHLVGLSEIETANKLLRYIQNLNQELLSYNLDATVLFSDRDEQIIRDAIAATICQHDSQGTNTNYRFSIHSIYQPYLYEFQPKISVAGSIIALADLGALGMDGVDKYIQDGILVFRENNPDYEMLVSNYFSLKLKESNCSLSATSKLKARLLSMARFMVNFAYERKARFELEISGFSPSAQQILREQIFIYLTQETLNKIETMIPTKDNASLEKLINFFRI